MRALPPWLAATRRRIARRLTPERLRWTVRVRGTVIALFTALAIAAWQFGALPALGPALVAAAVGTVMNLAAARAVARWEGITAMLAWTGLGDSLIITYVVVATGGTASPLLFLYVVQVLTTALVVDVALGALAGAASVLLLAAAVLVAEPMTAHAAVTPERVVWLSSLGVTIAFLVFVGGQLTRRLARSERELAGAHRRLTETHAALRDAYGRLARAEAELVETDRMKTLQLLVAGLAHELGNPLTVLAGTVEPLAEAVRAYERALGECARHGLEAASGDGRALRTALAEAAEARRETPLLLANCAEATSRATGLLAQLRDFGRGGRGTVRRLASVAPGLVGTVTLLRYRVPPGVAVHESYAEVPEIRCVPAELNQVFINLLMNALDAIGPAGNLWLDLAHADGEVRVTVRDDGPGIAPDVLPTIFEPFVTTKDAGRGTGLGLAISHAIVARHGGRIDVTTAVGRGTTFTVALPVPAPA
jgi:signal transduction histidine kinase